MQGEQQQRHAGDGAQARAHHRHGHRSPLVALEPRRHRGGDPGRRQDRPAQAQHDETGIDLPGRADLPDQAGASGQRDRTDGQHGSRPPAGDAAGNAFLRRCADQEQQRDGRGHLADRPALCGGDGLQVDAGAEQTQAPAEGRDHEASGDHPPTVEDSSQAAGAGPWAFHALCMRHALRQAIAGVDDGWHGFGSPANIHSL